MCIEINKGKKFLKVTLTPDQDGELYNFCESFNSRARRLCSGECWVGT